MVGLVILVDLAFKALQTLLTILSSQDDTTSNIYKQQAVVALWFAG